MGTGVEGLRWGEKIARKWLLAEADRAKRVGRIVVKGSGKGLQWRRGDRGMVT